MRKINGTITFKQITVFPRIDDTRFKVFNRLLAVLGLNNQVEFPVPSLSFFYLLLIGHMQKFADIEHHLSFLVDN